MSLDCTVISLVPLRITEEKPGLFPPRFYIEESDTFIPKILHVYNATHYVYLDESRGMLQVKDPSDVVARAIVNDYCTSQLGTTDEVGPALWWVDEHIAWEDVLNHQKHVIPEKRARQHGWFVNLAKMADDDWTRYHKHVVISDFQRKVATLLGLNPEDHEWMMPLAMQEGQTRPCPFCKTSMPLNAVICTACNEVIDYKRKAEIEEELKNGALLKS